jgi:hypothetical protein
MLPEKEPSNATISIYLTDRTFSLVMSRPVPGANPRPVTAQARRIAGATCGTSLSAISSLRAMSVIGAEGRSAFPADRFEE